MAQLSSLCLLRTGINPVIADGITVPLGHSFMCQAVYVF